MNEKLTNILTSNNINFTYDSCYGGYIIHDSELEEFETVCKDDEELKEYIESDLGIFIIDEECWKCKQHLNEYTYCPTIYFNNGDSETLHEELITGMTMQDMRDYKEEIKEKYENVESVEFGEFCPYCLSCM